MTAAVYEEKEDSIEIWCGDMKINLNEGACLGSIRINVLCDSDQQLRTYVFEARPILVAKGTPFWP